MKSVTKFAYLKIFLLLICVKIDFKKPRISWKKYYFSHEAVVVVVAVVLGFSVKLFQGSDMFWQSLFFSAGIFRFSGCL